MSSKNNVLGTFTGKCCDYSEVNNNGMFLSQELFESLMQSEDYKTAIKNGYYIGFLGHPEDPNDMNFKNACVVMRDMNIEDNGDVTGTFDLIDTPVGRIVKAFTDAGVKFGISIRGAGDVAVDGTVDPDTFVFRGFDLVTFPAYNDCVPEFQAIAASTDADKQSKYKQVCAAVKTNLQDVTSCEAIEVMQDQFNAHSDEYSMLADRATELQQESDIVEDDSDTEIDCFDVFVLKQKVKSLTQLYAEKVQRCADLMKQIQRLEDRNQSVLCSQQVKNSRMKSIVDSQNAAAKSRISELERENKQLKARSVQASAKLKEAQDTISHLRAEGTKLVLASNRLKQQSKTDAENAQKAITSANLVSNRKIEANQKLLADKEESIRALQDRVSKTVAANTNLKKRVSNLEAEIDELSSKVSASESIIFDYQKAYADYCAYAAGVAVPDIPVTASTTVDELRSFIYGKAASCSPSDSYADDCENENEGEIYSGTSNSLDNLVSL